MAKHGKHSQYCRNAVAVTSFVVALLVIGTLALWLFQVTASGSSAALGHYYSTGVFYAAEGGIEMSLREISQGNDFDSDGAVGTISDTGSDADDPALATGAFHVLKTGASPPTYQATGRSVESTAPWSSYRRVVEVETQ